MKYAALIYGDESREATMTEEDNQQEMAAYWAFQEKAGARAESGEALHPTKTARTVRVRNGQVLTSDGPFAETKEQLGGYLLIDAHDLNDAMRIASRFASARIGCVEIRPVKEWPGRE